MNNLLGKYNYQDLPPEHQENLGVLLNRIEQVEKASGKNFVVTSGYRSMDDQIRIYKQKGITDPTKIPIHSKHLTGSAVDIYDPTLTLTQWLKDNPEILESAQLWAEEGNKNWVHLQIFPPASGARWFLP